MVDKKTKRRSSDLTNQVFGNLKVIKRVENINGRPVSSFDLTDIRQQKVCFNWRNRQPLWSTENRVNYSQYSENDEKAWIKRMRDLKFNGDLFTLY